MPENENIANKIISRAFAKKPRSDFLIQAHHVFMINYGWIPLEEFKNMPIPTFLNLSEQLKKMADEINRRSR